MIQYTREAVATIRSEINRGVPPDNVRRALGWGSSMFDNICRQHGIDARAARAAVTISDPGPLDVPARVMSDESLVNIPIALKPELIAKIEKYAAANGLSRFQATGHIVAKYIGAVGLSQVQMVARSKPGAAKDVITVATGIEHSLWVEIHKEARGRATRGVTVGALIRACLIRYFEFE